MAKEVKETTIKEAIKTDALPLTPEKDSTSLLATANALPAEVGTPSNWQIVDEKATEVRLSILDKLQAGLEGKANAEYLVQLAVIYNNIR